MGGGSKEHEREYREFQLNGPVGRFPAVSNLPLFRKSTPQSQELDNTHCNAMAVSCKQRRTTVHTDDFE